MVKACDGTSVQLDDTAANQKIDPQPSGQKPGCGFPVMDVVALVNLSNGGPDWKSPWMVMTGL